MDYVTCYRCKHWDDLSRRTNLCSECNNSKLSQDPQTFICNNCGDCLWDEKYESILGLKDVKIHGGYNSYHLFDSTTYSFNLCEKCLRAMFNQFKTKPQVHDYMSGTDDISFEEDQKYYEDRLWRDSDGPHQNYLNGKCNENRYCTNDAKYSLYSFDDEFTENCFCEDHKSENIKLKPFVPNNLKPFL